MVIICLFVADAFADAHGQYTDAKKINIARQNKARETSVSTNDRLQSVTEGDSSDVDETNDDSCKEFGIGLESINRRNGGTSDLDSQTSSAQQQRPEPRESVIANVMDIAKDHFVTKAFTRWKNTDILRDGGSATGFRRNIVLFFVFFWLLIMGVQIVSAIFLVNAEAQTWAPSASGRWRQELFIQKTSFALLETGFVLSLTREHLPRSMQHFVYLVMHSSSGIGSTVLFGLNLVMASAGTITIIIVCGGFLITYYFLMFRFMTCLAVVKKRRIRRRFESGTIQLVRVAESENDKKCSTSISSNWLRGLVIFILSVVTGGTIFLGLQFLLGKFGGSRTVCIADESDIDCHRLLSSMEKYCPPMQVNTTTMNWHFNEGVDATYPSLYRIRSVCVYIASLLPISFAFAISGGFEEHNAKQPKNAKEEQSGPPTVSRIFRQTAWTNLIVLCSMESAYQVFFQMRIAIFFLNSGSTLHNAGRMMYISQLCMSDDSWFSYSGCF